MKKTILLLTACAITSGSGATITLAPGFGVGVVPDSLPAYVAIGGYIGFDPIGASVATLVSEFDFFAGQIRNDRLGGLYTGFDASFNSAPIYLFVGDGVDIDSSSNVAIFLTNANFAADVTQADSQIINVNNTSSFVSETLVGTASGNSIGLAAVPEPSTLILGAASLLCLLRRKR